MRALSATMLHALERLACMTPGDETYGWVGTTGPTKDALIKRGLVEAIPVKHEDEHGPWTTNHYAVTTAGLRYLRAPYDARGEAPPAWLTCWEENAKARHVYTRLGLGPPPAKVPRVGWDIEIVADHGAAGLVAVGRMAK